ncbi:MAG TPA: hypothetical protein PKW42_10640, partial [bacterium]|nr:hypothetical protein [bacterium]
MRARGLTLTGWFLVTVLSQLLSGEEIFPGHPNLEVFGQRFFSEYARITRPAEMPVSDQYVLGP